MTREEAQDKKKEAILTFLKKTKEGEYAEIDTAAITYARLTEQRERNLCDDEDYFYSVS